MNEHTICTLETAQLGDFELLALVLGGRSHNLQLAASLLERFGSICSIHHAEVQRLVNDVPGLGTARAVRLKAAIALGLRCGPPSTSVGQPVTEAADAAALFGWKLRHLQHEELHCAYLNSRLRPMAVRRLSSGSDRLTVVDPMMVLRPAVALGARALILAHNHPSGDPNPSAMDISTTEHVYKCAQILSIQLVDHLIIAGDAWTSLADRGTIPRHGIRPRAVAHP